MQQYLSSLESKGVVIRDTLQRRDIIGPKLTNWEQYDYQISQFYREGLVMYPWVITTRMVFPGLAVALISFWYERMEVELDYWMDLESIMLRGLEPMTLADGSTQDMVWLCEKQADAFMSSYFQVPHHGRYPELDYHLKYFFDVLYGVRGYEDENGHLVKVAADIEEAEKFRELVTHYGIEKVKRLLEPNRFYSFCDELTYVEAHRVSNNDKKSNSKITKLSNKL